MEKLQQRPLPSLLMFVKRLARGATFAITAALVFIAASALVAGCSLPEPEPMELAGSEVQSAGTEALFISVHAVSDDVAWAAGTGGTYARTVDGGATWKSGVVAGADSIQFRDVHGFSANAAVILSIGNGSDSRIYRTDDGGATWELGFQNENPDAFFDCMAFWDDSSGLAFSDSVDEEFVIITTNDGGRTWQRVASSALPPALPGEGSFAASGTCVTTHGSASAWIGTGAGERPRILRTTNRGKTWTITDAPIVGGSAAGIASVGFRDALNGFAIGGDLGSPNNFATNVALTNDGGLSWTIGGQPSITGMLYGAAWIPDAPTPTIVATSPKGVTYSTDNGLTWQTADTLNYWGVDFHSADAGWTVGTAGKITRRYLRSRD